MNRILFAVMSAVLVTACYDPNLQSGRIACSAAQQCPSGLACAPDGHCWKPGDSDIGRAPVRVEGGLTSNGGLMHSGSYRLVGRIGPSELSGTAASSTHRALDGVSAQMKGR
ncbi:MAG: hypothetical protein ACJ784_22455 [Myxococcales bacterium]